MSYKFQVQELKRIRVIIDTDAAAEADDPFAIVHALLTPKFIVKGIIAEQFVSEGGESSVDKSYAVIKNILSLMGNPENENTADTVKYGTKQRDDWKLSEVLKAPVAKGAELPLASESDTPDCEGADLIIKEALREDDKPLYVLCQGAVTTVAAALNKCPEIADKFTCIWIGGGFYPRGGWEFNLHNDYHAANVLFKSKLELWQIPMDCYTKLQTGYAELQSRVTPCGKIGRYLFDQMQELGMTADWISGECWGLCDNAALGVALNPGCGRSHMQSAPLVDKDGFYIGEVPDREIRVFHDIDSRFILEDFFSKLRLIYG